MISRNGRYMVYGCALVLAAVVIMWVVGVRS